MGLIYDNSNSDFVLFRKLTSKIWPRPVLALFRNEKVLFPVDTQDIVLQKLT